MIQEGEVTIRPAKEGDCAEIANVHLNSWREAYMGLLPQEFLDQLPLTFKRRMLMWRRIISEESDVLQVAETKSGIVGFATFSKGRDVGLENLAELGAIYLLEKHKGKSIGFSLLSSGLKLMKDKGFKEAYCWVLDGNPTIKFYERTGAKFTGQTKEAEIGGKKVLELAYQWDKI